MPRVLVRQPFRGEGDIVLDRHQANEFGPFSCAEIDNLVSFFCPESLR